MSNKKKGTTKRDIPTEEVTDGIQKLVKATAQEPIVLDQEEDDEPQGSDADSVVEEEATPEPEIEVVEGEIVGEKVEDPAALAQLSGPPSEQRSETNQMGERAAQQPNAVVEKMKQTIYDRHGNRGQLAVEFAKAILSCQGLKSNSEQIVKRSFEITDGIQAEIDRCYNEEMTRMITGKQ